MDPVNCLGCPTRIVRIHSKTRPEGRTAVHSGELAQHQHVSSPPNIRHTRYHERIGDGEKSEVPAKRTSPHVQKDDGLVGKHRECNVGGCHNIRDTTSGLIEFSGPEGHLNQDDLSMQLGFVWSKCSEASILWHTP